MDQRPPVMGDLLEINQHLIISCHGPDCGRTVRLSALEAVRRLGFHTTIAQAERRARCAACGRQGRHRWIGVRPCSLDRSAADARSSAADAAGRGEALSWSLDAELGRLQRLLGHSGELGGDRRIEWPVEGG